MPTGYTSHVADGTVTNLREFALICARAMGACIMMRDEPWDAPIPEAFEPRTDYHDEQLAAAQADLERLPAMALEECEAEAEAEYQRAADDYKQRLAERQEERNRYKAMLAQVVEWDTKAEGIKSFMLDQLRESIDHDCDGSWDRAPTRGDAEQWRAARLRDAQRDVEYHGKAIAEEIERTASRNRWLAALRESLREEEPA